jgi:hypothetical protein
MRSVNDEPRDDRGAVMLWVGLMLVVLVGVGALTVDLGALHVERQRLRTGAEAAALAVARDCVGGDCGPATQTATAWAPRNDPDGAMAVTEVCGVGPRLAPCPADVIPPAGARNAAGWVHVETRTATPDGGDRVNLRLAPLIDAVSGATLNSRATVAWGGVSGGRTVPLTMSLCEFQAMGGNPATGVFPSGITTVFFHGVGNTREQGVGSCTAFTSGMNLPGGFGWLVADGCTLDVRSGEWIASSPGNAPSQACRNDLASWRNAVIEITLFDAEAGQGSGGQYRIVGVAAFRVTGYRFPRDAWPTNFRCPGGTGGSATCIRGEFTRVSTTAGSLGGIDFGVITTRLVG